MVTLLPSDACGALQVASLLWAFAKADVRAPLLFAAAATDLERRGLGDFSARLLSNLAWACGKSRVPEPRLLQAISAEVQRRGLERFAPQAIANVAYRSSQRYSGLVPRPYG